MNDTIKPLLGAQLQIEITPNSVTRLIMAALGIFVLYFILLNLNNRLFS